MKFGMGIMPLGTFLTAVGNTNMVDKQTCEVGSTLVRLAVGLYSGVWL
jgi:hypothetical protein